MCELYKKDVMSCVPWDVGQSLPPCHTQVSVSCLAAASCHHLTPQAFSPGLSFSVYVLPPKRTAPLMHVGLGLGAQQHLGEVRTPRWVRGAGEVPFLPFSPFFPPISLWEMLAASHPVFPY